MDLNTIVVPPEEAEAKLAEYAAGIASERSAEDEAIAQAYRAARRGQPVISLPRTIEAGGWFDNGLPRLAVAAADTQFCHVTITTSWNKPELLTLVFAEDRWHRNRGALVGNKTVRLTVTRPDSSPGAGGRTGGTFVPLVPPACRPRRPRLARLHVLWEVEEWANVAPVDPALIRHIRGDLWSVLATWDLTPLERAVLSQRA